ncbi:hypothetical protein HZB88_03635 [archaeon]|nr:hypothetical protein [archaeon]
MQLGKLEDRAVGILKNNKIDVFKIKDLRMLLGINKMQAYNLVKSLKKKGIIKKIKNGIFSFTEIDEFVLATSIHYPSYISFWTALSYYKFTDNMPKKIFIVTTKYAKEIDKFRYVTLSKKRFFGYTKTGNIIIAEKEKAIIDSLLFPKYSGGIKEIIKCLKNSLSEIDIKKLIAYAMRIESKSVLRRLGYILEFAGYKNRIVREKIRRKIGNGYEKLDPNLKRGNNLNKKWLLDINC